MTKPGRTSIGFGEELDDLPSSWERPAASPRPSANDTKRAAEGAGFHSREPAKADPEPSAAKRVRRRRTGRNAQFNLKTTPETIAAFMAIADAKGWGLGETFERATELLQREFGS